MKMRTASVLVALILLTLVPAAWAKGPVATTGQAIHHDTSPPLRDMAIPAPRSPASARKSPSWRSRTSARTPTWPSPMVDCSPLCAFLRPHSWAQPQRSGSVGAGQPHRTASASCRRTSTATSAWTIGQSHLHPVHQLGLGRLRRHRQPDRRPVCRQQLLGRLRRSLRDQQRRRPGGALRRQRRPLVLQPVFDQSGHPVRGGLGDQRPAGPYHRYAFDGDAGRRQRLPEAGCLG